MVVVILLCVPCVKADGGISDERQNVVAERSHRLDLWSNGLLLIDG
jgi:hypothetical protein